MADPPEDAEPAARLRRLLRAQASLLGVLDLQAVLRRTVEAACDLVGATYGTLGVVSAEGSGLGQFVQVGVPHVDGTGPDGGLAGTVADAPGSIRLEDVRDDPGSVGFPSDPPVHGFLGVPIRVRDEVYGALNLATVDAQGFDAEDEQLVSALASAAGTTIENARLYETARRRQGWLQASADTTLQMLTGSPDQVFEMIGRSVKDMASADLVTVVQPNPDRDRLVVEVAVGVASERLMSSTYPLENTISAQVLKTGQPVVVDSARDTLPPPGSLYLSEVVPVGPAMVLPLVGVESTRGALVVARLRGRPRFTDDEVEMATTFANHASITLELVEARRDQQRVLLLEDRARIARDLHDHVIQQLFAAGMGIQGVAAGLDELRADQLEEVVGRVDEAIRQIRASIFQLTPHRFGGNLRSAVMDVVAEMTPVLGFDPDVSFTGPVDLLSDPDLTGDVAAVVREALTNVARHAAASRAQVTVSGNAEEMMVCVTDDGLGLGNPVRRSGLDNIRRRAEQRAGTLTIEDGSPGTRLVWTASVA